MTTDTTFAFSRNHELLEEVSQFQSQILNRMMQFVVDADGWHQEMLQDEIQAYKCFDV